MNNKFVTTLIDFLKKINNTGALVPIFMILIIVMMIVPLPAFLLDIFLTLNITLALLTLLITIFVKEPLEFSVFPALLLILTLFRLALNISTTRLILLQGKQFSGEVIRSFGEFVVGGNYVVGFVIFLILIVIQFVVITRGATRVSEVAARFTLDKIPVKMMSIDNDLNNGLIDAAEAMRRRMALNMESDFYGSMDGASKFVSGDAIAGIIITVINIIGGFIIGILQQKMGFMEAAQTFTLLTVGDGLVSQVPALLISTATGILVTRSASQEEGGFGEDVRKQLLSEPKILIISGWFLLVLGLVPGLPHFPFLIIAFILLGSGWYMSQELQKEAKETALKEEEAAASQEVKPPQAEDLVGMIQIDPLELEIGYGIIPMVDPARGGDLLNRIATIRKSIAVELGLLVPPIRIRDNMNLEPNTYVFKIKGIEIESAQVYPDMYLAMYPRKDEPPLNGIKTLEPAYKLPAYWIDESEKDKAESLGYTVIDAPSVFSTHLTELLRRNAHEIMDREILKTLIENTKEHYPTIVEEITSDKNYQKRMAVILRVLKNLLREQISIKNIPTILEAILDYKTVENPDVLTEFVRVYLGRQIVQSLKNENGEILVLTLSPNLEEMIRSSLTATSDGKIFSQISPEVYQKLYLAVQKEIKRVTEMGLPFAIITNQQLRPHVRNLLEKIVPGVPFISWEEISETGVSVRNVGMIKV